MSIVKLSELERKISILGLWNIYAIVAECSSNEFVVKIGVSSVPLERYASLSPGIPFHSIMIYAPVISKSKAFILENKLHKNFSDRNTVGEWFMFDINDKKVFHDEFKAIYAGITRRKLEWLTITRDDVKAYNKVKKVKYEKRKRYQSVCGG